MHRSAPALATRRQQRGAIAIIVGLTIVVMIGFAGLALDGGRLYVNKSETQNAADACALAAAYELIGAPNIPAAQFPIATNAGVMVAARNRADFQGSAIGNGEVTVEFGTLLSGGAWLTAAANPPPASRYVRCTVQRGGLLPWFMQVLGFGAQSVASLATASLANAQTNCGIPIGVCSQGGAPDYGLTAGRWYDGHFSNRNNLTGSFNWIDFSPPSGGASELAELLRGNGACNMNVSNPVGQPGNVQSIANEWNSRFGLYQGAINIDNSVPDRAGYSYTALNWPSRQNALADFLARRASNAPYGSSVAAGNDLTGLGLSNAYSTATTAQLSTRGADRRLAVAPIVNCGEWAGSQTIPIRAWACVLMLHPIDNNQALTIYLEYLGLASDPSSPCATSGVAGGAGSVGPLVPALVQ